MNRVRMPVGDFPTVFPTILKCWLNRMVTALYTYIYIYALYILHKCTCTYILDVSKRGVLGSADDYIEFFPAYSVIFYWLFFCWSWTCFFWQIPANSANLNLQFTIRCCMFSAHHDIVYCSWKDLFAIYMHILHICNTWKRRSKMRQEFWSFRGFRTK